MQRQQDGHGKPTRARAAVTVRKVLAQWLLRFGHWLTPAGYYTTAVTFKEPLPLFDDGSVRIVPEEHLPSFLLTGQLPNPSIYAPTRFDQELAEMVAKYSISLVVTDKQACACITQVAKC